MLVYDLGDSRIDRIFGKVSLRSYVIVLPAFFSEWASLTFHFVGSLPGSKNHFTSAPHRLAIRVDNADRAHIVEEILCSHGFTADATLRESDILAKVS